MVPYFIIFVCTFVVQTLGNSDIKTAQDTKSGEIPASVVLLLLVMFIALGFIGIRHIRRDYLQQQSYLMRKKAGNMFSNISSKTYGSTISQLNEDNIDEYIDDRLYGDWNSAIIDRLNHYRRSIQHRFIEYMEQTPEPVLFEANADRSVEAYCNNPAIPSNPNYEAQPFKHSDNYDPTLSPALQKMFELNYEKNKQRREQQEDMSHVEHNKVSVTHSVAEHNESAYSGVDPDDDDDGYDAIPERNAYSDSDREISDGDNGHAFVEKNNKPLITKVVVLDLD